MYHIVNSVIKACIQGINLPILIVMNFPTLLEYTNNEESLDATFEMMKYGAPVDIAPRNLGGDGGLYVD